MVRSGDVVVRNGSHSDRSKLAGKGPGKTFSCRTDDCLVALDRDEPHADELEQRVRLGWSRSQHFLVTLVGVVGDLDAVWQVERGFADELQADGWGTESAGHWGRNGAKPCGNCGWFVWLNSETPSCG